MSKRPPRQSRGGQRRSTFLSNDAKAIIACDFFVAFTATFRMLYVFVVIEHGTRRLAHVNMTSNPSAEWTLQQLRAVVGEHGARQYLFMTGRRSSPSASMIRSGSWVSKCC